MRILFLFVTTLLFGRINPFIPVVTNKNSNIVSKTYFKSTKFNLPDEARVIKSITINYQTITGSIKQKTIFIDKEIDWHNPIFIETTSKKIVPKIVKIGFLKFKILKNSIFFSSNDKMIRNFLLLRPFRLVIDFKGDKTFLTYSKEIKNSFISKIVIGNHKKFYRIVVYLDGKYKIEIKNRNKGYLIEFK